MASRSRPDGLGAGTGSEELPRVSIIIPCPPEMSFPKSLRSLRRLDYPRDRWEVIVAKGRNPSRQRNLAASAATGEILFFLDDDSEVPPRLLRENVSFYENDDVACVGGPNLSADGDGPVATAVNCVLGSLFGDFRGCRRFARRGRAREVGEDGLILCNTSVRRDVFCEAEGFPEELYPNEENAFFSRVQEIGSSRKLVYAPDAFVKRARPATIWGFASKMFAYGVGRLNQTFVSPSWVCALRLVASLFPIYVASLPLVAWPLYWIPAMAYVAGNMVMSAKIFTDVRSLRVTALAAVLFPAMHIAYGSGIIYGLFKKTVGLRSKNSRAVEVFHAKRFAGATHGDGEGRRRPRREDAHTVSADSVFLEPAEEPV